MLDPEFKTRISWKDLFEHKIFSEEYYKTFIEFSSKSNY